jgi:hypothetical protein
VQDDVKVAMGITMQHVLWAVKIISNRLKKCKEKPVVKLIQVTHGCVGRFWLRMGSQHHF